MIIIIIYVGEKETVKMDGKKNSREYQKNKKRKMGKK